MVAALLSTRALYVEKADDLLRRLPPLTTSDRPTLLDLDVVVEASPRT
jgi:hypothetical protein